VPILSRLRHAPAMQSGTDKARPAFRRRQTLATLPPSTSFENEQLLPAADDKSPRDEAQPMSRGSSRYGQTSQQRFRSPNSSLSEVPDGPVSGHRRLQWRASGGDGSHGGGSMGTDQQQRQHRRLGRTPSSPSVLLSKVKERIRETVCDCLIFTIALYPQILYYHRYFKPYYRPMHQQTEASKN
jgi:hypothetical protein